MIPVLFQIGSFKLYSFGVMMVVAFFAGIHIAKLRGRKFGLTFEQIGDLAFWTLIFSVLGARIVFILIEWDYYSKRPNELFSLQFQGLTSFGGLIFGIIAALIWAKRHRFNMMALLDVMSPAFLVGHAIGRIGCLLNGCCYGHVCPPGTPFGVHAHGAGDDKLHIPAQAYDSAMNLAALWLLLVLEKRFKYTGQAAGVVLILHGIARFIYEFWRAGSSSTYWGSLPITEAQAMAFLISLAGVGLYLYAAAVGKKRGDKLEQEVPVAAEGGAV